MAFYLHSTSFMCLLNEEIVSKLLTDLGTVNNCLLSPHFGQPSNSWIWGHLTTIYHNCILDNPKFIIHKFSR